MSEKIIKFKRKIMIDELFLNQTKARSRREKKRICNEAIKLICGMKARKSAIKANLFCVYCI